MTLLFFQNCISPHQIPYIRECAKSMLVNSIYVIVPRIDYKNRQNMGWNSNNLLKNTTIHLYISPKDNQICELLKKINTICLFSGIRADKNIFHWFKLSLSYKVKRYIITEPPFTYNKPLWMHYIRFYLQDYKFIKYIDGIFGFGQDAVNYYKSISKHWKVFPFQYVRENIIRTIAPPKGKTKLLFVGSLSKRKNVKIVIEALKGVNNIEFNIVGNGEEYIHLKKLAVRNQITSNFIGVKPMDEIPTIMQQNDILILPSLHDGWGAVINEAMTLGLYVISSDRCGAKTLISDNRRGLIFKSNNISDLKEKLLQCISQINIIRNNTNNRIKWAESIQGPQIAKYLISCLLEE